MDYQTRIHQEDGKTIFEAIQDCTPIAEDAKARHREGFHGSREMRHAARLPSVLVEKYCNDKGITFQEWANNPVHVRAMLTDPALSHFRVWGGAL